MDVTKELQKFEITDTAIAELKSRYMTLTIAGLDDREGFDRVHEARMDIKGRRVSVTKIGKDLREEANAYNKKVIAEEKRILSLLEPIETHLETEENRVKDEKERIKREAEEKETARIKARVQKLYDIGMGFNGIAYIAFEIPITQKDVTECTDEQFEKFVEYVESVKSERLAKEEAERLEREEKQRLLDAQAEEQRKYQAELEAKAALLQKEADRLEADKMAAEYAKRAAAEAEKRAEELEQAKKEAAEQAVKDEQARLQREAEEKAAAEAKAASIAKRKETMKPDKEKLVSLALAVDAIVFPVLKTQEAQDIMAEFGRAIMKLTKDLRTKAEAM